MTREEQITYKAGGIADGCIAHGAPWEEYYKGFIEGAKWADANPSQPSLPSNLDEAAQRIAYDVCKQLPNGEEKDGIVYYAILAAIAGAEWMAGQGVTKEAVIGMATEEISINVSEQTLNELDLCPGDKVVVQIRKK